METKKIKFRKVKAKTKDENGVEFTYDLNEPAEPIDYKRVQSLNVTAEGYEVVYNS